MAEFISAALALGQRSSEETSQRWRAVGDADDLTERGIEPDDSDVFTDAFFQCPRAFEATAAALKRLTA